ncbi:Hypothetical protein FKW44_005695 [Caligus rogercresseyi]|uniref:Uncharacterized protein n=1 Tax=Caligus rogercresseyi TaxID=217165 RepID=A0A7T8QS86_CALRO|nr:Hypothetical protein FKW44_005695 [Caligus rogercresseyi]
MAELEYQLTMNNSSRQPKSNPNITKKSKFSPVLILGRHICLLRGAMAELDYQLKMNNSSCQPKLNPNYT